MVVLLYVRPSPGPARCHIDARSLQILFARKMPDTTRKAIGMPEAAIDEHTLEITGRAGDTSVRVRPRHVHRYANLSEC